MMEHAVAKLVQAITDTQRPLSRRLGHAALLSTMPDADDACTGLLDTLHPNSPLGRGFREVLVTAGTNIDALCVLLWESPSTQRAAVSRLTELGDSSALPDLIALLQSMREQPRRDLTGIIRALEAIGSCWVPGALDAPRAGAAAVGDMDATVRTVASANLRRMGSDAAVASELLLQLLESAHTPVRFSVAELLPDLTPPAVYVPWMVRLLHEDDDELIRWVARYELSRLSTPDPLVTKALAA
jgi:hypothetical protein